MLRSLQLGPDCAPQPQWQGGYQLSFGAKPALDVGPSALAKLVNGAQLLGQVRDDQPPGSRGRRCRDVGDQVEQRRIALMTNRTDYRRAATGHCAHQGLVAKRE